MCFEKKEEKDSLNKKQLKKRKTNTNKNNNKQKIDQGEEKQDLSIGRVGLNVYWRYFRLGVSKKILLFILIINLIWQVMFNSIDFTIAKWLSDFFSTI